MSRLTIGGSGNTYNKSQLLITKILNIKKANNMQIKEHLLICCTDFTCQTRTWADLR